MDNKSNMSSSDEDDEELDSRIEVRSIEVFHNLLRQTTKVADAESNFRPAIYIECKF